MHFLKTSDGRLPNGTAFVLLKRKGTGATAALAGAAAATVARLAESLDGKEWDGRRVGVAVWERRERPREGRRRGEDGERGKKDKEAHQAVRTNFTPITT